MPLPPPSPLSPAPGAELEQRGVDVIRGLAIDGPRAANSGHPGAAMALAPLAHVLFTRVMRHDPSERYGSPAEMVRELHEFLEPRSRTLVILGSVILLLCLVLAWSFVQPRQSVSQPGRPSLLRFMWPPRRPSASENSRIVIGPRGCL